MTRHLSNTFIYSFGLTTTSLQCQNTSERRHNSLSHLRTGRAAQGPCDYLCSHGGQTLPLQSLWICAASLYFQQPCCPLPDDQGEYPLYVESWSSSMSEPSLCEMGEKKSLENNQPGTSAAGVWLWHQLLKITTLKIPGPELLAGRMRTFHTHNTRLPGHAKSWQAQLLGPLQDVLPLRFVVDVMTVNPQSAEHFPWLRRGRLFLRSRCCW